MAEDEMVGWHHRLNGLEFEQFPGDNEAWHAAVHGVAGSDMTEQLKNHKVLNLRITSLYFLGFNNLSGNFNFRNYFD